MCQTRGTGEKMQALPLRASKLGAREGRGGAACGVASGNTEKSGWNWGVRAARWEDQRGHGQKISSLRDVLGAGPLTPEGAVRCGQTHTQRVSDHI